MTKEGKFQIEQVVIQVDEWLILGPGVWHAGDHPYLNQKSKLLFLYYEHGKRRNVNVEESAKSPFAVQLGPECSEITERNTFPWYLERRSEDGETHRYHYENNISKYEVAETDRTVSADAIAASITRFDDLQSFRDYLQQYGLPEFNNTSDSWRWIQYEDFEVKAGMEPCGSTAEDTVMNPVEVDDDSDSFNEVNQEFDDTLEKEEEEIIEKGPTVELTQTYRPKSKRIKVEVVFQFRIEGLVHLTDTG